MGEAIPDYCLCFISITFTSIQLCACVISKCIAAAGLWLLRTTCPCLPTSRLLKTSRLLQQYAAFSVDVISLGSAFDAVCFPHSGNNSLPCRNYSFDGDFRWNQSLSHHCFDRSFGSKEPSHIVVLALRGAKVNCQRMQSGCPIPH
jgi:hypothetical protein